MGNDLNGPLSAIMQYAAPGLAPILQPILQNIGEQVGGAQGREIGRVAGQGLQQAENMIQQFMKIFEGAGGSGGHTTPGLCPKSPCPFSPGRFPPGIFDNPSRHLPRLPGNDPGFTIRDHRHSEGLGGIQGNDPGFTIRDHRHPEGLEGIQGNDPGFTIRDHRHSEGLEGIEGKDPGFTVRDHRHPEGTEHTNYIIRDHRHHQHEQEFNILEPSSWPSMIAKLCGGKTPADIRREVMNAEKSNNPAQLLTALTDETKYLAACSLMFRCFNEAKNMQQMFGQVQ